MVLEGDELTGMGYWDAALQEVDTTIIKWQICRPLQAISGARGPDQQHIIVRSPTGMGHFTHAHAVGIEIRGAIRAMRKGRQRIEAVGGEGILDRQTALENYEDSGACPGCRSEAR